MHCTFRASWVLIFPGFLKKQMSSRKKQADAALLDDTKIKEMFDMLDADGGGTIDTDELTQAFVSLGISDTREEIDRLVQEIDTDGSGEIEFSEFREVIYKLQSQRDSAGEIYKAFNYFSEGKERITFNDIKKVSIDVGDPRPDAFLKEMFVIADTDKDGFITFQDFRTMMERAIADEKLGLTSPNVVLDAANERDGMRL